MLTYLKLFNQSQPVVDLLGEVVFVLTIKPSLNYVLTSYVISPSTLLTLFL